MSIFDTIEIKEIILILIILLLAYKLWEVESRCDKLERYETIEGLANISDEAIQDIASVYSKDSMSVTNLNVTGKLSVNGESVLNGKLTAKSVPSLSVGSLNVSSNATVRGNTTLKNTTTHKLDVNGGCAINGKHPKYSGATLTVMDPSGKGANSHFYYGGGYDTYIGGGNNLFVRARQYPSGVGQKTLLRTGRSLKMPFNRTINIPVISDFKW